MKKLGLWLELIVQFFWLAFLIILVTDTGTIHPASIFLNPRFYWLLYLSIFFFAVFLSNTLIKILLNREYKDGFPSSLYLLIPLFFFVPALKADLGSKAVERRGIVLQEIQKSKDTQDSASESIEESPEQKNPDGTDRFISIFKNPEQSIGRKVSLIGQATFNPSLPEGSFYLFKFIIFCCVADASPAGFIITGIETEQVETNKWYKIRGIVEMTDVKGNEYLSVNGKSLEQIEPPSYPYETF